MHNRTTLFLLPLLAIFALSNSAVARSPENQIKRILPRSTSAPAFCTAEHNIGKLVLSVTNLGNIGSQGALSPEIDCFTGKPLKSGEYPKGSSIRYLWAGGFWIGAIVGRDTLVSASLGGASSSLNHFQPKEPPIGNMIYRSIVDPTRPEFEGAISEQDYIAIYQDTCKACRSTDFGGFPHEPLNVEIEQRSYSWSYSYAEDFVLFDYGVKNIGTERLRQVYMGIFIDADVGDLAQGAGGVAEDDVCGFQLDLPASYMPANCPAIDTVFIAYLNDTDGDFNKGGIKPAKDVTGVRIVRTPSDSLSVSFNWWIRNPDPKRDFGPQSRKKYRDLGTGAEGTPFGDKNRYAFMSNGEFDYNQVFTASITPLDTLWRYPNQEVAGAITVGIDTRYLLSFGPFEIDPGQTLPLSFAYIAGEDFHTDPDNAANNLPDNPVAYMNNLDFTDLGLNATWSSWIYDNPGVDSDSDGYAGKFRICALDSFIVIDSSVVPPETTVVYDMPDTIWYEGDGIPDFRGATPPPSPASFAANNGLRGMRVEPSVVISSGGSAGRIRVRWNGIRSETTKDIFSRELDFEGYRVWLARDDRSASYNMLASYDIEDYSKYVFNNILGNFGLLDTPFTLDELRALYAPGGVNDSTWHPTQFPQNNTFQLPGFPDSVFYFVKQDFNQSELGVTTPIIKTFPNAPKPPQNWSVDSVMIFNSVDSINLYLTEADGFFKFYEYEYTIENLLPTVPYWVNVTAFDFGSPSSGLPSLETSRTLLPANTYASESVESVEKNDLQVYTFPNPYRIDANYRSRGLEGREDLLRGSLSNRVRAIHFVNLPPKCTISIFSLDGDLVQQIDHDIAPTDPLANHHAWDMITRNSQLAVSGLYYWTVEIDGAETQIGKIVIIM